MRAVWLPPVEDERKRLPEDNAAPVQGVPTIAEGGTGGPSLMTSFGLEEDMGKHRAFLQRPQTRRLVDHQEGARTVYVRPEPVWADAWPHLDDWFKAEALLRLHGMNRPITI